MIYKLQKGDRFKLNEEALDNYGESYRNKIFEVEQWFDRRAPIFSSKTGGIPRHSHPGYDEEAFPQRLYEFKDLETGEDIGFAVYDWEIEPIKTS